MSTAERDAFLAATMAGQERAEIALRNGDITPRLSIWSHDDPVTLCGAAVAFRSGWGDVRPVFERLAGSMVACEAYDFELLAADASGDMAYTVGIERYRAKRPDQSTVENALRVTHIFRREAGGWKVVHRHGDHLQPDSL